MEVKLTDMQAALHSDYIIIMISICTNFYAVFSHFSIEVDLVAIEVIVRMLLRPCVTVASLISAQSHATSQPMFDVQFVHHSTGV